MSRVGVCPERYSETLSDSAVPADIDRRECPADCDRRLGTVFRIGADVTVERGDIPILPQRASDTLVMLWDDIRADDGAITLERLQTVARHVTWAARAAGVRSEELIIALKASWSSAHGVRRASERNRLEWIITELVSLSIEEFYRSPGEPPGHR